MGLNLHVHDAKAPGLAAQLSSPAFTGHYRWEMGIMLALKQAKTDFPCCDFRFPWGIVP